MKEILFVIIVLSITPFAFAQEYPDLGVKVETFAENLDIPWSIVWAPDGTIFFTESRSWRSGRRIAWHCIGSKLF
jgi:glucose/arabinose dehydrogenase